MKGKGSNINLQESLYLISPSDATHCSNGAEPAKLINAAIWEKTKFQLALIGFPNLLTEKGRPGMRSKTMG
ncbi:hypothetical protein SAY87_009722 [Trapa incisa]|nr:hypothetical protein SAY87_009722 [Trapa incisa]